MNESTIYGVSVRSLACLLILLSFCALAIYLKEITSLKEIALIACGYLFGKQQSISDAKNVQVESTVVTKSVPDPKLTENKEEVV